MVKQFNLVALFQKQFLIGFLLTALALLMSMPASASPIGLALVPSFEFPPKDGTVTGLRLGLYSEHQSVYGLDLNLIGAETNKKFVGTQISTLYNKNNGSAIFFPLQLSLWQNINESNTNIVGLQFGLLGNFNNGPTNIVGAQIAAFNNYNSQNSTVVGIRLSMWNGPFFTLHELVGGYFSPPGATESGVTDGTSVYGLDISFFGNSSVATYGLQVGIFNYTGSLRGLQVGVFNVSDSAAGLQIGLVNYTKSLRGMQIGLVNINRAGPLPFFPIINVGF